ncbi:class I SAM-dependent methyltransferase [Candidatus Galacturonibacter soehngenii]|uniref:Class I SAM-dependent methyltransferase n=1 Tax=Candidatus Galacturonatibacter soehngenii TaxID=2307010 RepID=A0A7V7UHA9_9FIRM|nr:class I SAM-dependent methyltransferase [Candidatus Galacturonibacter soehngenii]KAB1439798.1 class I SAM-dependent methyltransferase [Candidatus Galacturonibacter soehngenii]
MKLLDELIEQAKNPRGWLGKTMLNIMNQAHNKMTVWGLEKVQLKDKDVILDIGCGGGQTLKILSSLISNGTIYGVDYSEKAVATSTDKNWKDVKSKKIIVKQADVTSLPFPEDFFDIITAFQTHYFWPDLKNNIVEVNRILKQGGQFLLVAELYKINYHMKEYKTVETLKELFLRSGFSTVTVSQTKTQLCMVGEK